MKYQKAWQPSAPRIEQRLVVEAIQAEKDHLYTESASLYVKAGDFALQRQAYRSCLKRLKKAQKLARQGGTQRLLVESIAERIAFVRIKIRDHGRDAHPKRDRAKKQRLQELVQREVDYETAQY